MVAMCTGPKLPWGGMGAPGRPPMVIPFFPVKKVLAYFSDYLCFFVAGKGSRKKVLILVTPLSGLSGHGY